MNGKTLVISGVLTLGLLAPVAPAVAAPTDNGPGIGGLLGNLFDRDDRDDRKKNKKDRKKSDRHNVSYFRIDGEIRSIDRADRKIVVDLGKRNRAVHVAKDAKIWRDGDRVNLRDLRRDDDVRITGEKRNGRYVAKRIVAD
ncbi:hypothetical protein [Sporichthya polymorpha]|uniref:hypothetical protein n=1 Tax=Sporichthya polymorpha TaxID=35751 RepID=UPI00036733DB|nr:hypothetical protein [Sporichthya polymorpha]